MIARERERELGQPCVAGFFKSLQLGKIISNNPPLACISLLTRSLRWPWRCIISLVRWLRQIRLSREQVRQNMTASNAIFDSSKLHLTCRQQNVTRLSNKQLQSENIFPDKFQICGVGTTWPRHHEILFEVGRSSQPEICGLKLPDFASEPPKILAIHAFSCSNDLLWPWLLAMSLWVSDWCLA